MLNVQQTKDTFYAMLRNRIAAGNPARTVVVRGMLRPGVLVVENELPGAAVDGIAPAQAFCLRWNALKIDLENAGALITLTCEIRYASDGSPGAAGLDRGRALAAMDAELASALATPPRNTATLTVVEIGAGGSSSLTPNGTNIFWGEPSFAPSVMRGERLERTAQVEVFGYGD
jgi:hypothetical protein